MVKFRKKTKCILLGISTIVVLLTITAGLFIYSIIKNADGGSDTWFPYISFYRSLSCVELQSSNRVDYENWPAECNTYGIRLVEADMKAKNLSEILSKAKFYYTNNGVRTGYDENKKIYFSDWQCRNELDGTPIFLDTEKPTLGKNYRCWPKNTPLPCNIGIASNYIDNYANSSHDGKCSF